MHELFLIRRPDMAVSVADVASGPSCRWKSHGPGRSRALAPLLFDAGRGDGRGYTEICAGGTPVLP